MGSCLIHSKSQSPHSSLQGPKGFRLSPRSYLTSHSPFSLFLCYTSSMLGICHDALTSRLVLSLSGMLCPDMYLCMARALTSFKSLPTMSLSQEDLLLPPIINPTPSPHQISIPFPHHFLKCNILPSDMFFPVFTYLFILN